MMNLLDRAIAYFDPQRGMERVHARATLQQIQAISGGKSGYDAGKLNRLTKEQMVGPMKENEVPVDQIRRIRDSSWHLYRNNRYAKKIVRSLTSKVIGRGMCPESQATHEDGSPHIEFRRRTKQLWKAIQNGLDSRGMPGNGGQTFVGMQKLALRTVILSGDVLNRLIPIDPAKQAQRELPVPVLLQVIDASRLIDYDKPANAEVGEGNQIFRGIEYNVETGERVRYWIRKQNDIANNFSTGEALPIAASQINHLYIEDDVDQMRGTGWFSAAIIHARNIDDLEYNVLKSSAMAACIALAYKKPTGTKQFGLNASNEYNSTSADGTDLTDTDGNTVSKLQPGMLINVGKDGGIEGFSPTQPTTNLEAFSDHMLRGVAAAIAGTKGSTVTGDYRNSSFSSERAADNDTWPEIEDLQDWFAEHFCQPVFSAIIKAAISAGYYEGIVTADEFVGDPNRFLETSWQGPVCKTVNPLIDTNASGLKMKFGLASLQMECAKANVNWLDVLTDIAELYEVAKEKGIPEEVVNNILGVDSQDVIAAKAAAQAAKTPADSPSADDSNDDPAPEDQQSDDAPAADKKKKKEEAAADA